MTIPDSPVAATFVAAPDNWSRGGATPRAIVCHMAEGAGTVSWLTRNDGNSSHYVVELSGRVVQMVFESRAAGSMNASLRRTTDDAPFTFEGERITYGATAFTRAFGSLSAAKDPNRWAIAIEVEGFAKPLSATTQARFPKANPDGGPNDKQRVALFRLVNDIRQRRGPLPVVGHRDQQSYKACPGKAFPWKLFGGHGAKSGVISPPDTSTTPTPTPTPPTGGTVNSFAVPTRPSICTIPTGTWLYDNDALQPSANNIKIEPGRDLPYIGKVGAAHIVEYVTGAGVHSGKAYFTAGAINIRVVAAPAPPADTTPFSQADLDEAAELAAKDEQERIARAEADRIRAL